MRKLASKCSLTVARIRHSQGARLLCACMLSSALALAQSGDISGDVVDFGTLGTTVLKVILGLAVLGFVGLLIAGGLQLTTNRPRGLAMVGGGLVGALLAGLSFALVSKLTGQQIAASVILLPFSFLQ